MASAGAVDCTLGRSELVSVVATGADACTDSERVVVGGMLALLELAQPPSTRALHTVKMPSFETHGRSFAPDTVIKLLPMFLTPKYLCDTGDLTKNLAVIVPAATCRERNNSDTTESHRTRKPTTRHMCLI